MTPDQHQRAAVADPTDAAAAVCALQSRARVEGPAVYGEALRSRSTWNAAPELVQDFVIGAVKAPGFEFLEARVYGCEVQDVECGECDGGGYVSDDEKRRLTDRCAWKECSGCDTAGYFDEMLSHRLGVFRHVATGAEFVLVPGGRREWVRLGANGMPDGGVDVVAPLLVARWPMTNGQGWRVRGGRHPSGCGPNSWDEGSDSIELHPMTGLRPELVRHNLLELCGLRLPTAQEWQHFAKAGASTRFYWGDQFDASHVWYRGNSGRPLFAEPTCEACHGSLYVHGSAGLHDDVPTELIVNDGASCPRCRPSAHAPKGHDALAKWNAFGLVDVIGNVSEFVAMPSGFPTVIYGDYSSSEGSLADGSTTQWTPGETPDWIDRVGFRPVCGVDW